VAATGEAAAIGLGLGGTGGLAAGDGAGEDAATGDATLAVGLAAAGLAAAGLGAACTAEGGVGFVSAVARTGVGVGGGAVQAVTTATATMATTDAQRRTRGLQKTMTKASFYGISAMEGPEEAHEPAGQPPSMPQVSWVPGTLR